MLRFGRIDLYLMGEVAGPFMGGLIFFTFLFLMFQMLRLAEFFIVHGVKLSILGRITFLLTLQFLPNALPIAFLVAVLVGFGRLSSDNELVALKASGVGILRLALPVSILATIVVALSLALNLEWSPWSERESRKLIVKISNTKVVSSLKEGTFTSGFFDMLVFAESVDRKTNKMSRVFIYDEREPKNPLTVVAQSGEFLQVRSDAEIGMSAVLKLYNGNIHRNDVANGTYSKIDFGEYRLWLKIHDGAAQLFESESTVPYDDMMRRIRQNGLDTDDGRHMRGELARRIGIAMAPLLFVFYGIGFGTFRTRAIRAGAALISFLTLLVYWGIQVYGASATHRGVIHPYLAMSLPNIAIALAAIFTFRKAAW